MKKIRDGIFNYYQQLYLETEIWRPQFGSLSFWNLENEDVMWLEREFTKEEVAATIKQLNGDKALGLDGFNIAFFQCFWEVVKGEVMSTLREFHENGLFVRSLNAIFVALSSKKVKALNNKGFRPISVVGCVQNPGKGTR